MADPVYLTINEFPGDGVTTQYEFNFAGGYIDKAHVKAFVQAADGLTTQVVVTAGMFVTDFTLDLGVAAPVGGQTRIYRDTPREAPLIDFNDGARITARNLDLLARQTVFCAAEAFDAGDYARAFDLVGMARDAAARAEAAAASVDLGALTDATTSALASASMAAGSEDAAAASAAAAAAFAALSEAASSSASTNADLYPSTAAGLAAVADGEQFQVAAADGLSIQRYRRDPGPVAVAVGPAFPTAAKVDRLGSNFLVTPDGAFNVVDKFGQVGMRVTNGDVEAVSIAGVPQKHFPGVAYLGATETPAPFEMFVADRWGNIAFGVGGEGVHAHRVTADLLDGKLLLAKTQLALAAEVVFIPSYGQSLSIGADSGAPITTAQRFDSLSFAGGVRTQHAPDPYSAFQPLVETFTDPWGETPISGAFESIKERMLHENRLPYTDCKYQLLGSAPGVGGTAIANLSLGSPGFTRMVNDMTNGYSLAQAAGKSYKALAMFWTQGEQDYPDGTTKAAYKAALVALRNDYDAAVKAVTGQSEDVVCISYQTQNHGLLTIGNDPRLGEAQWEVCQEHPGRHYVACPLYWSGQRIHQTAANYKRLGAYYGLAYKRIVVDGDTAWRPLSPRSVYRQGTVVTLTLNVPHGQLQWDTGLVEPVPHYGFTVNDASGADVPIVSVEITGPNTVKVVTSTAAPGGRLRYGTGMRGGNLRDSQGDAIVFDPDGLAFPMHNWCVIFNEPLGS